MRIGPLYNVKCAEIISGQGKQNYRPTVQILRLFVGSCQTIFSPSCQSGFEDSQQDSLGESHLADKVK